MLEQRTREGLPDDDDRIDPTLLHLAQEFGREFLAQRRAWAWYRPLAMTFSATACSMKPSGAITLTLPASTSPWLTMPRTPPKWSLWLWV